MIRFRMLSRNSLTWARFCSRLLYYRAETNRLFSQDVYEEYSDVDREKILNVLNESPIETLSNYNITKTTLKRLTQWKENKALVKSLNDVIDIEGVTQRSAKRLFDGILEGPLQDKKTISKIKGNVLQPTLDESIRKNCKTVATIFITINSVSWVCIDREKYQVTQWKYKPIDFPDVKKMQITDIFNISWNIVQSIPLADIYVMQAEATTLRAAGSDPNNPKVISINLQKAQMVAMMVALINARSIDKDSNNNKQIAESENSEAQSAKQIVYFLRPTLPYRLYGTLVGNEKVSTDQVVEILLQETKSNMPEHFKMSEELKCTFQRGSDLQKDMLGHCLLLGLTFMDICLYRNQEKIQRLSKRGTIT